MARTALKTASVAFDTVLRPQPGLVVLIYHRVGRHSSIEVDLPAALFADQMAFLAAETRVVSLSDGLERLAGSRLEEPLVAITFDDGTADFADEALPLLVDHKIPVTLYVATRFVDEGISFPDHGVPLTWNALREACSTGLVEVGSHTHGHMLLDRLPEPEIGPELDRSIELIEERVGQRPVHFAYPKAVMGSDAADVAVRARFDSAAVAGTHANPVGADPYRLARSPIQLGDGMRWFRRKARGGLAFEDTVRRTINRRRYAGAIG